MARLRISCVVVCLTLAAGDAIAQTMQQLVDAARANAASATLTSRAPDIARQLEEAIVTLGEAGVLDEGISAFVKEYTSPGAVSLARRRQGRFQVGIKAAVDTLKAVANSILAPDGVLSDDFRNTMRALQTAEQEEGLTWELESLRRFERKFGPGSPKLNGVEVLVAYSLQRLPAFGIDADDRPGPLEVVLAYAPSYITRSDDQMRIVGLMEIGLRRYIFTEAWGSAAGRLAWLRPGYTSFGLAWSGQPDDPLVAPWKGDSRFGAFFGWGSMKVAWLAGDDQRLLFTQQFQAIPWIF